MKIEISREQIRRKALDDDCKTAKISRNEYGADDNRCFCNGLIDCSTEEYLQKCVECRALAYNAKPLQGETIEQIRDKRLNYMIEALTSARPIYISDCVSALRELKDRREDRLKYEAALQMMAGDDTGAPCRNCIHAVNGKYCDYKDESLGKERCVPGTVLYYKRKAGLEVSE